MLHPETDCPFLRVRPARSSSRMLIFDDPDDDHFFRVFFAFAHSTHLHRLRHKS